MTHILTIKDWISRLLDILNVEYEAETIPLKVESFSESQQCFGNVAKKVERDGGRAHCGWLIHTDSRFIIEAERHVVWENDNLELIDVTPQEPNVTEVIFVSDDVEDVNSCKDIDNVRLNKTNNQLVDDFIKVSETLTAITFLGERLDDYQVALDSDIAPYISKYGVFKNYIFNLMCQNGDKHSPCFCGSGNPYDRCHGRGLTQMCNRELLKIKGKINNRNKKRN